MRRPAVGAAARGDARLVAALLGAVALGVLLLVQHTRALAAAHADVAALFEEPVFTPRAGASTTGVVLQQTLQQQQLRSSSTSTHAAAAAAAAAAATCAPDPATGVLGSPHTEMWGDVVVGPADGQTVRDVADAGACCALCAASKSCNTWVFCADTAACGSQCWLKRQPNAQQLGGLPHAAGPSVPWTSGVLAGKALDVSPEQLAPPDDGIAAVELVTTYGAIKLRLRPEWSNSSVAYIRALAAQPELCTDACAFYRVEPGFLLQGSLRARLAPNQITTRGPRHMVRGDCGWAGGSAGPDFFCYLGAEPASHWGYDHTVWAEIADAQSFTVAETINALPPKPTKPGEMHLLAVPVPLDVRVAHT